MTLQPAHPHLSFTRSHLLPRSQFKLEQQVLISHFPGFDLEQHWHCRQIIDPGAIVPAPPGIATTTCSAGFSTSILSSGITSSSCNAQPSVMDGQVRLGIRIDEPLKRRRHATRIV
jgi:hypothetical protein